MLRYNAASDSWLEIGKMERGRASHAIAEVNLGAICAAIGTIYEDLILGRYGALPNFLIRKKFYFWDIFS